MSIALFGVLSPHAAAWPGPSYGAYGWPWPGLIWLAFVLLFWGGLIALLVWAVRMSVPRRRPDTAMDVLRRRLASGEISQEEYEHIRDILQDK